MEILYRFFSFTEGEDLTKALRLGVDRTQRHKFLGLNFLNYHIHQSIGVPVYRNDLVGSLWAINLIRRHIKVF